MSRLTFVAVFALCCVGQGAGAQTVPKGSASGPATSAAPVAQAVATDAGKPAQPAFTHRAVAKSAGVPPAVSGMPPGKRPLDPQSKASPSANEPKSGEDGKH